MRVAISVATMLEAVNQALDWYMNYATEFENAAIEKMLQISIVKRKTWFKKKWIECDSILTEQKARALLSTHRFVETDIGEIVVCEADEDLIWDNSLAGQLERLRFFGKHEEIITKLTNQRILLQCSSLKNCCIDDELNWVVSYYLKNKLVPEYSWDFPSLP